MTESYSPHTLEPVRVHIASSDVPMRSHEPAGRIRRGLAGRSFTLTTTDPVQQILPLNINRCEGWVLPLTNDVTLYTSKADAQGGGNGGITVPAGGKVPFPVNTTDPVWATAAVLPTTVSAWAIIEGG
jgi:hypothetical protein